MGRAMKNSGISWIGEIPSHWRKELIGSCIKEINNLNTDNAEDNALQFKMGTIISKKGGDSKYNPESLEAYNKVRQGDIIINGLNLSFDFISQRVGLVKENGVITSTYLALRPLPLIDSRFLTFLFKGYDYCKALHSMGRGLRATLGYNEFRKYFVIFPSIAEQQSIADFLDTKCREIDEMVSLQEKIIEELKAYKQSVITEVVCKGLNPDVPLKDSGIEWIGLIPEGWKIQRFKDVLNSPLQYGVGESGEPFNPALPRYIRITDIANNSLKEDIQKLSLTEEQAQGCILKDGDILLARSGGTVGKAFIFKSSYGRCAYAGYLIRAQVNKACSPWFVFYYTQTSCYEEWKRQIFIQSTIQNIAADRYSIMELPIPPKNEQQAIADFLDKKCGEIDALISVKQSKIDALKEYKISIIYEYITGKKEVI